MDPIIDESNKQPPEANPQLKDPFKELPIKDFSYINNSNSAPAKSKRWPLVIAICLVIVILAGGAGYYLLRAHKPKLTNTNTVSSSSSPNTLQNNPANIPTTSYSSSDFGLNVNYPKTWSLTSNGTTSMTITSPIVQLTSDKGKTLSGKIVLNVTPQGQIPAAFGSANATAVVKSELVSYSNPTPSQRAQTYVSYVQYASTSILGGLDGIYVTGNDGYVKGQNIPLSDLSGLTPLVNISFVQCESANCLKPTSLSISSASWANSSYKVVVLNIIKSFSFT